MPQNAYIGTAKVFMNGRSQAVRLPAECRFDVEEVVIQKLGDNVILSPRSDSWDTFFARPKLPKDEQIPQAAELAFEKRDCFD